MVYGGDMTWPALEPGVAIATAADATAESERRRGCLVRWPPSEYGALHVLGTPGAVNDCP